jgi:hypothetical protein
MEAPSFSELLHRDMGAVSSVGPEVMDPQTEGKLELGYASGSCGDKRVDAGMLMGEVVVKSWS